MGLISFIQGLMDSSKADFTVAVDDRNISVKKANGETKRIAWSDLNEVRIFATEYSTVMPCIFWHLKGKPGNADFPDRANGSAEVLRSIHNLPGFNSLLCSHVLEGRYSEPVTVWKKDEAAPSPTRRP